MPDSSSINDSLIGVQQGEPLRSCLSSTNLDDTIRTTLSLSLTVGDKKRLKSMAMNRGMTIAALVHEWIVEFAGEDN